ncbi:tRNA pseudouridine(38-40) synthase TruA [Halocola ammonii]
MQRYFVKLAYDGTNYSGWQRQENAVSVQQTLEKCLSVILREEIKMMGCGRTDTGVHASKFYAHFDVAEKLNELGKIVFKLNRFLPPDIAIHEIIEVGENDHTRFDAVEREYQYFVHFQKNPFFTKTSYLSFRDLDLEKMNEAAELLIKESDFSAFCKAGSQNKSTICDVKVAVWKWIEEEQGIVFTIRANRFLRNMVRAVVGTLFEVGMGNLTVEDFQKIIESKDRRRAGSSAPARGLFLTDVVYPFL